MDINIGDFFIHSNNVNDITEEDYNNIRLLTDTVEAFARSTYKPIYIIDYFRKDFLYISDNLPYLLGITKEEIKKLGYNIYTSCIPKEEQDMLTEINSAGFIFFENLPVEERKKWIINYDFHVLNGKNKRLINHSITPIYLTKEGRVRLSLCTIALSANKNPGNIKMKKIGSNTHYEYSLSTHEWNKKQEQELSQDEKNMLILSAQGYTMTEISEMMYKSIDSIKYYKRRIFEKFNVKNITGALAYAINYKML
ncbi:MAG: helix-turn-helix transcriptional regulator [bacterium]